MPVLTARDCLSVDRGRPRVSDDNTYVESLFWTCKYVPNFPRAGFASLMRARDWVRGFVDGYNGHRLHRGINYVTPDQRHRGEDAEVLAHRHAVYQAARRQNPARWSGSTRNWSRPAQVWLNPENEVAKQAA